MDATLRNGVRRRAHLCCEYCKLPEAFAFTIPFQVEHIVARKHAGPTVPGNLALACDRCNLYKGTDLTGIDPLTGRLARLYHPRRMKWSRHFRWVGPILTGRTSIGRTTITVLQMNHKDRVEVRQALIEEDLFPPT